MKREFLQNLKVGDAPLTKEVIDVIMAENGRDIEGTKAKFADYEHIKEQLTEAQTALQGMQDQGKDLETIRESAKKWQEKFEAAETAHKQELDDMAFDRALEAAISAAKGRNTKAIMALLDKDTLRNSKNQEADIKAAVEACQKENDYLFGSEQTPPPFSGGTGTGGGETGGDKAFNFGFTGIRAHDTK